MVSKLDLLAGWPQLMAIPVTTVFSLSATHLPFPANDQVNPWYHHYPSLYPMKYPIMFQHFPSFSTIFHHFPAFFIHFPWANLWNPHFFHGEKHQLLGPGRGPSEIRSAGATLSEPNAPQFRARFEKWRFREFWETNVDQWWFNGDLMVINPLVMEYEWLIVWEPTCLCF